MYRWKMRYVWMIQCAPRKKSEIQGRVSVANVVVGGGCDGKIGKKRGTSLDPGRWWTDLRSRLLNRKMNRICDAMVGWDGVYSSSDSSPTSIQPRDISTALDHCLYNFVLALGVICGSKEARLARFMCFRSEKSFHTSMAKAAAIAAPRAVVSCMAGRSTGIWMISACVCKEERN